MTIYEARSEAARRLEAALTAAGMQNGENAGSDNPCYFRITIPKNRIMDNIVMRYQITDTERLLADDNWSYCTVYIDGVIFVNRYDGIAGAEVSNLISQIETECRNDRIGVDYSTETGNEIFGDATSATEYVHLEFIVSVANAD